MDKGLPDATALALAALGWLLDEPERARRFLDLTGLTPEALRDGLGTPSVQAAILDYLAAFEPDLVAAADHLAVAPERLVEAARLLER